MLSWQIHINDFFSDCLRILNCFLWKKSQLLTNVFLTTNELRTVIVFTDVGEQQRILTGLRACGSAAAQWHAHVESCQLAADCFWRNTSLWICECPRGTACMGRATQKLAINIRSKQYFNSRGSGVGTPAVCLSPASSSDFVHNIIIGV